MKRYDLFCSWDGGGPAEPEERTQGEWVRYEDVERLIAERDAAEGALRRHGYRKSCDIPACNCGDQWNHDGHAATRLREISEELCDLQSGTLLDKVKALRAERDAMKATLRTVLGAWPSDAAPDELKWLVDEAKAAINAKRKA